MRPISLPFLLVTGLAACWPPPPPSPDLTLPRYPGLPPLAASSDRVRYRFAYFAPDGAQIRLSMAATPEGYVGFYHEARSAEGRDLGPYHPMPTGPADLAELQTRLAAAHFWEQPTGLALLPAAGGTIIEGLEGGRYHAVLVPGRPTGGLRYACDFLAYLGTGDGGPPFPC